MTTYKEQNLEAVPTYDAMVYQSGLYTTAVDKNGTVLSSGLIADYTDNVQIAAAVASCPAGGTIVLRGNLVIAVKVTCSKSINIVGIGGCSITLTAAITGFGLEFESYSNRLTGTTVKAATPAIANQNFAYFTSYTNVNVGSILIIRDSTIFANTDSITRGEGVRVKSKVAPDQVYFYDRLFSGYNAAGNVDIYPPITVNIKNISFSAASQTHDIDGVIRFLLCADSSIEGCKFDPCGDRGIVVDSCYNFNINGNTLYNADISSNGYGIEIEGGCRNIHITNNTVANCRHCVTCGATTSESVNVFIEGNTFTSGYVSTAYSFNPVDAHAAWSVFIKNNQITMPYNDSSATGEYTACILGVKLGVIQDNDIFGCNYIYNPRQEIADMRVVIRGNRFHSTPYGTSPAYISMVSIAVAAPTTYESLTIDGNDIWGCSIARISTTAIGELIITNNTMHTESSAHKVASAHGISINGYANIRVEGNVIQDVGESGIVITSCSGTCIGNKIRNPGRRATGTNYGIQLAGTAATNVFVTGNFCQCTDAYMTYGIAETGTAGNLANQIVDNKITRSGGTADYLVIGTGTTGRSIPATWQG
jgi:parallel beta-helix repeat protein